MKPENFPDFLIVGPQRTGTTWLYHNLKSHPQILLPDVKETYYFSTLGNPDHRHFRYATLDDYLAIFRDSWRRRLKRHYDCLRHHYRLFRPRVTGEATATYAGLDLGTIRQITAINPDIKAIMMIRDPVERAWSHAKKDLARAGKDLSSTAECLPFLEKSGQLKLADYRSMAANWREALAPGHLFFGDYQLLARNPLSLLSSICRFLCVNAPPGGFSRHVTERVNPTREVPMPGGLREHLEELFADERRAARELLGLDQLPEIGVTRDTGPLPDTEP